MGFLGSLGRSIEKGVKSVTKNFLDPGGLVSDAWHGLTGSPTAKQMRAQMNLANEQMNLYREQTRIAQEELDRKRDEMAAEKRRVEEKQVRSLRRNFRPAGFLDNQDDLSNKLGG